MNNRFLSSACLAPALGALLFFQTAAGQTVRFQTNLGDIDVVLLPESAPATVENFLKYVRRDAYRNSFFHRSVPGFIIQGGGFKFENNSVSAIPSDPPVRNEYRISNTRGTLAMAKLGSDPNSATNQWFFNLANNAANLNSQNGGFTVFGRVADSAGLAVMDRIAAVPIYNAGSPFEQIPLQNFRTPPITAANLVMVTAITILEPSPAISENGVISASSFGGFASAAPGSYIEIYGANLAGATRSWQGSDFTEGRAPTALDGVTVTVDGKSAFVNYISPAQINVQVPADVATGTSVPVVVSHGGRSSTPAMLAIKPAAGGLLAPAGFKVEDRQYVAAIHHAGGSFVTNGRIPNLPAAPAVAGETLTFYGIGFGPVSPGAVAGQIATGITAVTSRVQFQFGDAEAQVTYAGLVPDLVGVYQFNVVVPSGLPGGDVALRVLVAGEPIGQALYIPTQARAN